VILSDDTG